MVIRLWIALLLGTLVGTAPATAQQRVADTKFSVDRGFYAAPFTVAITTTTPGAEIRYTLDGSVPSPTHGAAYTEPVPVTTTTVLRAMAHKPGMDPTNVDTHTYLFLDDVLRQREPPPGYPSAWSGFPADYEMDPEVVTDPRYQSSLKPALEALPSLSVVLDVDSLFGPDGLYQNPEEEGSDWERSCSAELLFPDGAPGFQVDAGLRIQGGASRRPRNSPKHSLRLLFRGRYGATKLRYPLFDEAAADAFDTVVLRAGYNNTWIHANHTGGNQRRNTLYIRDQWTRDAQRAMGQAAAHGRYVHLYLNGLYWGLYNLTERPTAAFAAAYYGGDKEDYDATNSGVFTDGDGQAWDAMMTAAAADLADEANYAALQAYLDVDNLIDYMILNHAIGNHDWDEKNWYAARRRERGAGFMFFSWDAEHALEVVDRDVIATRNPNKPTFLFHQLRANADFRMRFADRVHRHLTGGGALTPAQNDARFRALAQMLRLPVVAESARWGDYRRDVHRREGPYLLYTRDDHWQAEHDRLLADYFPDRTDVVLAQYRTAGLYPSVAAPALSREGGVAASPLTITISNPNGAGALYYTTDGTDPRLSGGAVNPASRRFVGAALDLTWMTTTVFKGRILQDGVWSPLTGATYLMPSDLSPLRITELMYHPPDHPSVDPEDLEFIELQNTGAAVLNLTGVTFTDGVVYTFPAGTTLEAGEFTVLASHDAAFEAHYGIAPDGVFAGHLSNGGERVALTDGTGRQVLELTYDDEAPWPAAADGGGYSLVRVDPDADANEPATWGISREVGGSPGRDDPVETSVPNGDRLMMEAVYPHPVRTFANVRLHVPEPQHVRLVLYDALGRTVQVLHDGLIAVPSYPLRVDMRALAAGVYLLRLEGPRHTAACPLLRVK